MIQRTLFYQYDPSGTFSNGRFYDSFTLRGYSTTSGSSTTTTALEVSGPGSTPYDQVVVGDWLLDERHLSAPVQNFRRVTAKASSSSLTVNSAWDLTASGRPLKCLPFREGTTNADGGVFIGGYRNTTIAWNVTNLASTTLELRVQGRNEDGTGSWVTLTTATISAVGGDEFSVPAGWQWVRVALRDATGSAAGDAVNVYLVAQEIT